jgi:hypothetical protein
VSKRADPPENKFPSGILGQQNETGVDYAVLGQAFDRHAAQSVGKSNNFKITIVVINRK